MRGIAMLTLIAAGLLAAACNTVTGAREDVKSVGRVFTDHPDGAK